MVIGYLLDDTLDAADGVQQAVIAVGEEMRRRGHEVHYIVAKTERADLRNVHSLARSFAIKFNGNSVRTPLPVRRRKIDALFEHVQFDVLHVQMPYSPMFAARVIRRAPQHVQIFGTFHILPYGVVAKLGTQLLGWTLRRSLRRLNGVFAVSEPAREFMSQEFGVDGLVLGNPVDYSFFRGYAKSTKKALKKRIVFVGRFDERKGARQLLDAFLELGRDDVELVMCGKGPLWEGLRSKVESRKSKNIEFPGFVSEGEKATYLASADIAVFPSTGGESFGIVLTEAMSAGAGVTIGGNNLGYASVLAPWPETLFDPNDTAAFAQLLATFLDNDTLRRQIGASQHDAVRRYDIHHICDELEKRYLRQN